MAPASPKAIKEKVSLTKKKLPDDSYYSSSYEDYTDDEFVEPKKSRSDSCSSSFPGDTSGVAIARVPKGLHKIIAERAKFGEPIKILTSSVVHGGLCFVDSMLTFLAYNKNIAPFLVDADVASNLLGMRTETCVASGE